MVTIRRKVGGLLRYCKAWFPSHQAVLDISQSLQPNEVVRVFGASSNLCKLPHLVNHRQLQTAWIDLSAGPQAVLKGMKRKSCRYEIRRAEKMLDRVEIEIDSAKTNRDFLAVYNDFAKSKGLPGVSSLRLQEYSAHGETLVLYLDGEPLCCHLLLCDADMGIVRLLYSGSRRLETSSDAAACGALNRYLHWHEMQRYHALGFSHFDFGGIRDPGDPISRFKMSFGAVPVAEHYYLFGGTQWIAKLGNLLYERVLRRRVLSSKGSGPVASAD